MNEIIRAPSTRVWADLLRTPPGRHGALSPKPRGAASRPLTPTHVPVSLASSRQGTADCPRPQGVLRPWRGDRHRGDTPLPSGSTRTWRKWDQPALITDTPGKTDGASRGRGHGARRGERPPVGRAGSRRGGRCAPAAGARRTAEPPPLRTPRVPPERRKSARRTPPGGRETIGLVGGEGNGVGGDTAHAPRTHPGSTRAHARTADTTRRRGHGAQPGRSPWPVRGQRGGVGRKHHVLLGELVPARPRGAARRAPEAPRGRRRAAPPVHTHTHAHMHTHAHARARTHTSAHPARTQGTGALPRGLLTMVTEWPPLGPSHHLKVSEASCARRGSANKGAARGRPGRGSAVQTGQRMPATLPR